MSIRSTWAFALTALLCCMRAAAATEVPPAAAADSEDIRQTFVAAMQRVRQHLPDLPDSPALESYVLHDYLVAARFRRDLATADDTLDAAIDSFLQAHLGQPVTHGLRRDWLVSLADRRRWERYLARSTDVTDPVLVCDRLEARLALGNTQGLGTAVLERWSQPQQQPPECDEVFAWIRRQNLLTPAVAEARTRAALMLDNPRLARTIAMDVPVARSAALLQWSDLLEAPKPALTVLANHPAMSVEPDALAAGFEKLTQSNSSAALELLPLLIARPNVTPVLKTRLLRAAALGAAYDHDPRAPAAFESVPADTIDAPLEEWRIRAALWNGDYGKARGWIERLPPTLATQPRWRYWRARAVAATGDPGAAEPLFEELAGLRDYYGYLAADRLHRSYNLNARSSIDDPNAQAAMAADIGLIRAHELFACDMRDEAASEWSAVLGSADPAVKVQAAHLAARWGWYSQSIAALAQAGEWDDVLLRYPRPYPDVVAEASKFAGVPADWIWAVMRQESLYRKDAVSRADARGLMQMRPATAAAVARRWHLPQPRKDSLFDPTLAIPLGAAYLRELLDRHAGQLDLSLAAYNAGAAAVVRWRPPKSMDADIWIENIPYTETRAYVQHILEHIVAFAFVNGAESPRLGALMPVVEPAAADL